MTPDPTALGWLAAGMGAGVVAMLGAWTCAATLRCCLRRRDERVMRRIRLGRRRDSVASSLGTGMGPLQDVDDADGPPEAATV